MDLYNLGAVTWWESQCFYHALAHLGREGLIICYPSSPYVCLGLHDDLEQEIDRGYCERSGTPIFRRETGGGAVYLDDMQVFFQLVVKRDNKRIPLRRSRYYETFLQPAISVYREFGIPAEIREPADIVAGKKKCSGNACGDIGNCIAYVGNLLLDFNFYIMSNILKVPNEPFRHYLQAAMRANMTTLNKWVDYQVNYSELAAGLINGFKRQWNNLIEKQPDQELIQKSQDIYRRSISPEWLQMPGRRFQGRKIKIAEGLILMEQKFDDTDHVMVLMRDGVIEEIELGGEKNRNKALKSLVGRKWNEDLLVGGAATI